MKAIGTDIYLKFIRRSLNLTMIIPFWNNARRIRRIRRGSNEVFYNQPVKIRPAGSETSQGL